MLLKLATSETASSGHYPQILGKKNVGNFGKIIIINEGEIHLYLVEVLHVYLEAHTTSTAWPN